MLQACSFRLQNGEVRYGERFSCSRPASTLNAFQAALIRGNASSNFNGSTDCVYNMRDTLLRSVRLGSGQSFASVEDIVSTLAPRGATAKIIGQNLARNWKAMAEAQARRGMRGWHAVDGKAYRRDFGRMYPNGIVFSGGTQYGHVSIHFAGRNSKRVSLDQYSTRALKGHPAVVSRAISGALHSSDRLTTMPSLVNRVEANWIFQWCHESWGCPSSSYWLD